MSVSDKMVALIIALVIEACSTDDPTSQWAVIASSAMEHNQLNTTQKGAIQVAECVLMMVHTRSPKVYLSALKQLDHVFTQPGTCKEVTTSYMESFRLAFSLGFMGLVFWENMPAGNPIGVLYVNHQLRNGLKVIFELMAQGLVLGDSVPLSCEDRARWEACVRLLSEMTDAVCKPYADVEQTQQALSMFAAYTARSSHKEAAKCFLGLVGRWMGDAGAPAAERVGGGLGGYGSAVGEETVTASKPQVEDDAPVAKKEEGGGGGEEEEEEEEGGGGGKAARGFSATERKFIQDACLPAKGRGERHPAGFWDQVLKNGQNAGLFVGRKARHLSQEAARNPK